MHRINWTRVATWTLAALFLIIFWLHAADWCALFGRMFADIRRAF